MAVTRVEVALGERSYPIVIDPDAGAETRLAREVAALGASAIGLVTDETVNRLHRPRVEAALGRVTCAVVADGEGSKSLATVEKVAGALAAALDRNSVLVALGGGVVGDLGGFVASILFRGIRCVQVPTTLMAQVDSSVGGKTAVNLPSGKNLVGTFWQPRLVYTDLSALATLPARDLSAGLAELTKHGVIADAALFARIEERAGDARRGDPALLAELVARSCAIKAAVVGDDERETAQSGRARLNFGHTVGHALETASHEAGAPLRHGEAVALGMLAAARVGAALGAGDPSLESRLTALWPRLGLPVDLDARLDAAALRHLGVDKKRVGSEVSFVVVDRVGSSRTVRVQLSRLGEILLGGQTG